MNKKFVTIFTALENQHLIKDLGQIPYFMHKKYNYTAEIVTYPISQEYSYLQSDVKGVTISFLTRTFKIFSLDFSVIKYIIKNSRTIDVLNLYHYKSEHIALMSLYRFLNPNGIVYVKLDIDRDHLLFNPSRNFIKILIQQVFEKIFFRLANIASVEILDLYQKLSAKHKNVILIPNGFNNELIQNKKIHIKPFEQKENIILTVGRIGTPQKNNELLLNAISQIDLKDWKVVIIGAIEQDFYKTIDAFYKDNTEKKESVIFTGIIEDRIELYEWYNRAKVFCLTSRYESFGIAAIEAIHFGDYIIITDVSSASLLTDNEKCGRIIRMNSLDDLKKEIKLIISGENDISKYQKNILAHSKQFDWVEIIDNLYQHIEKHAAR